MIEGLAHHERRSSAGNPGAGGGTDANTVPRKRRKLHAIRRARIGRRTARSVSWLAVLAMSVASLPLLPGAAHASDTDVPVSTALGNKLSNGGEASLVRTAAS